MERKQKYGTQTEAPEKVWKYEAPQFKRQYEPIELGHHFPDGMVIGGALLASFLLFNSGIGFITVCTDAYPGMKRRDMEYQMEHYSPIPSFLRPLAEPGIQAAYKVCLDK